MSNTKFDFADFRHITLEIMMDYIAANHPEDKADFKEAAFQVVEYDRTLKSGKVKHYCQEKYQHLIAARWFYSKYFPEYLPVAKEPKKTVDAASLLKDW